MKVVYSIVFFIFALSIPLFTAEKTPLISDKAALELLAKWKTLEPGRSTREDLLKIFSEQGGISNSTMRTYMYRDSGWIKVDVTFRLSKSGQGLDVEQPTDTILSISKPYIDYGAWD